MMNPTTIDQFKNKKILVIGDLILDKYIRGEVSRVSPEAPIPIVEVKNESYIPGGAANTAYNIASLGGNVLLVGVVGKDYHKEVLIETLKKRGVETRDIVADKKRPTTHKTRVIAQTQQLVRIDYEYRDHVDGKITMELLKNIKKRIINVDTVVVSDYAKGVITNTLLHELVLLCKQYNKKLIVDPKPQNVLLYKGAYLITPNFKEAVEMSQHFEPVTHNIDLLGNSLMKHLNCNVLITQGKNGMTLFEQNKCVVHIPTIAKEVYDVSGAGDTVVATLALALSCSCSLKDAAMLANYAAGIVVGKTGTAVTTPEELKKSLV